MRRLGTICLILFTFCQAIVGQGYDSYWISGYDLSNIPGDTIYGGTYIDFREEPPRVFYDPFHTMNFWGTSAGISDSLGRLLFYTNGMMVEDATNQIIPGGDTIGYGSYWESNHVDGELLGMNLPQGSFIIPKPGGDPNSYFLIHTKAEIRDTVLPEMSDILLTEVRLVENRPIVIFKDHLIAQDTFSFGKLAICRHANGNDWWLVVGSKKDNRYYIILISEQGAEIDTIQEIGSPVQHGVGQAGFGLRGNLYYRYEAVGLGDTGASIHIYQFDRCRGLLSNERWWYVANESITGAEASPNGRFLYTTDATNIWQWDLWENDIQSSGLIVAEYDGFVEPNWFGTYFGYMGLWPDGRIYVIPPTGGSMFVHTITQPNQKGVSCRVLQHNLKLPTWNARTMPVHADFTLGPLDGSPCDSLGLDNHPVARFRFEPELPDLATFHFTDLSQFDPETWHWDFGDGDVGENPFEIHTYEKTGNYEVCLTVSNSFSSSETCKEVHAEKTSTSLSLPNQIISIYPNPIHDYFEINPNIPGIISLSFFDINGGLMFQTNMSCPCTIMTNTLLPGIYFYQLTIGDKSIVGKLVKLD